MWNNALPLIIAAKIFLHFMITFFCPVNYIVELVKIISLLLLHIKDDKKTDN